MVDWQVGDLALCVDDTPRFQAPYHISSAKLLKIGGHYTVRGVYSDPDGGACLILAEVAPALHPGFRAMRFRKILPDKHESCEPEFVTLLKRVKVPLTRETAEQIRKWRAEDEANGMPWESTRDGGCANNAPPVNK